MKNENNSKVAIVGGGFSGLAAAQKAEEFADKVTLFDEGSYDENRRGPWGELVWNYDKIPLEEDIPGHARSVENGIFYNGESEIQFELENGAVLNRGKLENYWAGKLDKTEIKENREIDRGDFIELSKNYDLIVDASGRNPISHKFVDINYNRHVTTLSGRVEGDFSEILPDPIAISYEKFFLWINPQSKDEAQIGLGSEAKDSNLDLYEDMVEILNKRGIECPERDEFYYSTHVSNKIKDIDIASYELNNSKVMLVGDSLGLANSVNGFGLVSAVESAKMAVESYQKDFSYEKKLKNKYSWRDKSNAFIGSLQDKFGLDGTSKRMNPKQSYQKTFEPRSSLDLIKLSKEILPP